ncbi:MAG: hypothetical protein JMJ93_06955 [Synergistaceae bacterium]|jgi:hypothetical protein|nr:hypothetical protein [Synergistaceae bacterium]
MKRFKSLPALLLALTLSLSSLAPAQAFDLGDLIGVVGGGLLVKTIAGPINDFINTVTLNRGVKAEGHTKVVPIVSVGSGTSIGAAQVAGPKGVVETTKAVAQLDVSFQDRIGVKILVPIDSENPLQRFRRVQGVGVAAIIDYRL